MKFKNTLLSASILFSFVSYAYGQNDFDVEKTEQLLGAIAMQSNIADAIEKICPSQVSQQNIAVDVNKEINEIPKLAAFFSRSLEQLKPLAETTAKSLVSEAGGCDTDKFKEVRAIVEVQNGKLLLSWWQKNSKSPFK